MGLYSLILKVINLPGLQGLNLEWEVKDFAELASEHKLTSAFGALEWLVRHSFIERASEDRYKAKAYEAQVSER